MTSRPPNLPTLPLRQDVLLSKAIFEEIDDGITEDLLREHTGIYDLSEVDFIDLKVDAAGAGHRVESLGELLPNLQQLRLSQSHICTIRDLGTSLQNLKVLWLCRSSLQDLGGITALTSLEELYVSFNDITDLDPLLAHEALQIVDLEGNMVEDFNEVASLEAMTALRELNLSWNPVRKVEGVTREKILKALPQLEVLDDIPRDQVIENDLVQTDASFDLAEAEAGAASDDEAAQLDELAGVAELLQQVAATPRLPRAQEADTAAEESSALQELRRRAHTKKADSEEELEPPLTARPSAEDSNFERTSSGYGGALSGAVAEFHADAAKALSEFEREDRSMLAKEVAEPSEQDLILESLKRAERPPSNLYSARTGRSTTRSSRLGDEVVRRPPTAFFPAKRESRTAWGCAAGSLGSASTACASSAMNTQRSLAGGMSADQEAASDLTVGEDGAVLAGNPLAAIRRRRKAAQDRGEDDFNIRDLLRRYEPGVGQEEAPLPSGPVARPTTADVRINPGRPTTAAAAGACEAWKTSTSALKRQPSRGNASESLGEGGTPLKVPKPKVHGSAEVLVLS
eukprot:TRINITY_DN37093_c0_g1_i1.p1 TRINITY_DN37093_c0_g1~~TRINITY_DN37093_c0_g1_i1.p1  ORF type:complete len:573 (+),score=142.97 TRINITY_DN37093_c0_g1_i1:98-1816(+)